MVDKLLFENNSTSTLAAQLVPSQLTLTVAPGTGPLFPSPSTNQFFHVTLEDTSGNYEICRCTGRQDDVLTIERAQEGTVAQTFPIGSRCEIRNTAFQMEQFVQRDPGGFIELRGTIIKGDQDDALSNNALDIPIGETYATIGGEPISTRVESPNSGGSYYTASHYFIPTGAIIIWSGLTADIPTGWALCDGNNDTPDLRNRFVIGAYEDGGDDPQVGDTGGANSYTLSTNQMPAHDHAISVNQTYTTLLDGLSDHRHAIRVSDDATAGGNDDSISSPGSQTTAYTYVDGEHQHRVTVSINQDTGTRGSGDPIDNRPAYYALAFIMKTETVATL